MYKCSYGNANYKKVATIDGQVIFADEQGYFIFEHYPKPDGSYVAIRTGLGKTAKEVEASMSDLFDWNYRSWHGEMSALNKAEELVRALPDLY